jgi:uncharacterized membrane protein SpoIIM required for sporulation
MITYLGTFLFIFISIVMIRHGMKLRKTFDREVSENRSEDFRKEKLRILSFKSIKFNFIWMILYVAFMLIVSIIAE